MDSKALFQQAIVHGLIPPDGLAFLIEKLPDSREYLQLFVENCSSSSRHTIILSSLKPTILAEWWEREATNRAHYYIRRESGESVDLLYRAIKIAAQGAPQVAPDLVWNVLFEVVSKHDEMRSQDSSYEFWMEVLAKSFNVTEWAWDDRWRILEALFKPLNAEEAINLSEILAESPDVQLAAIRYRLKIYNQITWADFEAIADLFLDTNQPSRILEDTLNLIYRHFDSLDFIGSPNLKFLARLVKPEFDIAEVSEWKNEIFFKFLLRVARSIYQAGEVAADTILKWFKLLSISYAQAQDQRKKYYIVENGSLIDMLWEIAIRVQKPSPELVTYLLKEELRGLPYDLPEKAVSSSHWSVCADRLTHSEKAHLDKSVLSLVTGSGEISHATTNLGDPVDLFLIFIESLLQRDQLPHAEDVRHLLTLLNPDKADIAAQGVLERLLSKDLTVSILTVLIKNLPVTSQFLVNIAKHSSNYPEVFNITPDDIKLWLIRARSELRIPYIGSDHVDCLFEIAREVVNRSHSEELLFEILDNDLFSLPSEYDRWQCYYDLMNIGSEFSGTSSDRLKMLTQGTSYSVKSFWEAVNHKQDMLPLAISYAIDKPSCTLPFLDVQRLIEIDLQDRANQLTTLLSRIGHKPDIVQFAVNVEEVSLINLVTHLERHETESPCFITHYCLRYFADQKNFLGAIRQLPSDTMVRWITLSNWEEYEKDNKNTLYDVLVNAAFSKYPEELILAGLRLLARLRKPAYDLDRQYKFWMEYATKLSDFSVSLKKLSLNDTQGDTTLSYWDAIAYILGETDDASIISLYLCALNYALRNGVKLSQSDTLVLIGWDIETANQYSSEITHLLNDPRYFDLAWSMPITVEEMTWIVKGAVEHRADIYQRLLKYISEDRNLLPSSIENMNSQVALSWLRAVRNLASFGEQAAQENVYSLIRYSLQSHSSELVSYIFHDSGSPLYQRDTFMLADYQFWENKARKLSLLSQPSTEQTLQITTTSLDSTRALYRLASHLYSLSLKSVIDIDKDVLLQIIRLDIHPDHRMDEMFSLLERIPDLVQIPDLYGESLIQQLDTIIENLVRVRRDSSNNRLNFYIKLLAGIARYYRRTGHKPQLQIEHWQAWLQETYLDPRQKYYLNKGEDILYPLVENFSLSDDQACVELIWWILRRELKELKLPEKQALMEYEKWINLALGLPKELLWASEVGKRIAFLQSHDAQLGDFGWATDYSEQDDWLFGIAVKHYKTKHSKSALRSAKDNEKLTRILLKTPSQSNKSR